MRFVVMTLVLAVLAWPSVASAELSGRTYDYHYDGKKDGTRKRAWFGRAYLPKRAIGAEDPLPLLVFLHGLNKELIKYRWMGGGSEGDVREIVGAMVDDGRLPPMIIAGPSSVVRSEVSKGASWNHFDHDNFIDRTIERLDGLAKVDASRIIVSGHSGAGCSQDGGLATASPFSRRLQALIVIDTCMAGAFAKSLTTETDARTHVIVGYQTIAWKRPFKEFEGLFARGVKKHPPKENVLRKLDLQKPEGDPHNGTVAITFERWLPQVWPPDE